MGTADLDFCGQCGSGFCRPSGDFPEILRRSCVGEPVISAFPRFAQLHFRAVGFQIILQDHIFRRVFRNPEHPFGTAGRMRHVEPADQLCRFRHSASHGAQAAEQDFPFRNCCAAGAFDGRFVDYVCAAQAGGRALPVTDVEDSAELRHLREKIFDRLINVLPPRLRGRAECETVPCRRAFQLRMLFQQNVAGEKPCGFDAESPGSDSVTQTAAYRVPEFCEASLPIRRRKAERCPAKVAECDRQP